MNRQRFDLAFTLLVLGSVTPALGQLWQTGISATTRLSTGDYTKAESLQTQIDRAGTFLYVPAGEYELEVPLLLRSNLFLQFAPGTRVVAAKGAFRGIEDSLMVIAGVENVTIHAEDCTFSMRREDYRDLKLYKSSEWRHVLSIQGSRNITIQGGRYESSGGDGIYIGRLTAYDHTPCEGVRILNVTCHNNWRQGISVVGGMDLLIANSLLSGTHGTSPQAGIDVEPEYGDSVDVTIRNCISKGNRGPAYMVNLYKVTPARSVRIEFIDCEYSGVPADQLEFRTVAVFDERGNLAANLPTGTYLRWNDLDWNKW